jgi:hypothetical protein
MKNELQFFRLSCVNPSKVENLFLWWATHETPFSNVQFLAHQLLGIVRSQIETKRIFNITSVTTSLHQSKLKNENLQHFLMIAKN